MKVPSIGVLSVLDEALLSEVEKPRNYLGASEIGDSCERKLWYSYNKYPRDEFPARVKRIFKLGDLIEDHLIDLLIKAGFKVDYKDEKGEQFRVSVHDGRFSGGMDGIIKGLPESDLPHVLEIKSANHKRFRQFVLHGVKQTEKRYWAQVQTYMHFFKYKRAIVIVYDKDTSELYSERIKYDKFEAIALSQKALNIVDSKEVLNRAYSSEKDFGCKFCDYKKICWESEK